MHTTTAAKLICLVLASQAFTASNDHAHAYGEPVSSRPEIRVFAADRDHLRLVGWAATRFERVGLEAPAVGISFHSDTTSCSGHIGYEVDGRIDVCVSRISEVALHVLLHEIAHRWIDDNVSESVRDRFIEERGLRAWNELDVPWNLRGYEQGAEIIAWGLGTRYLAATIPDRAPIRLVAGFKLLTDVTFPQRGHYWTR